MPRILNENSLEIRSVKICRECRTVLVEKNEQYGNAIESTGLLGAVVECVGMTARLVQLVIRNSKHGRESPAGVYNVLLDLHNYSVIAMKMLGDSNFEGRDF